MQSNTVRPLGIGGIIDRAFGLYRQNFGRMVLLSLLLGGSTSLLVSLLNLGGEALRTGTMLDALTNALAGDADPLAAATAPLVDLLQWVRTVLINPLVVGGITLTALKAAHGEGEAGREAMQEIKLIYVRLVITAFCMTLISLAIVLAFGVLFQLIGLTMDAFVRSFLLVPALLAVPVLILALLVVPTLLLALAYPVALGEQRLFFSWLPRACKLLFRKFWKSLAVVLMTGLMVWAPAIILSLLSAFLPPVVFIAAVAVITGLLRPISIIAAALLYIDIRIATEGYDLELSADGVPAQRSGATQPPYLHQNPGSRFAGPAPYGSRGPGAPHQPLHGRHHQPYPGQPPGQGQTPPGPYQSPATPCPGQTQPQSNHPIAGHPYPGAHPQAPAPYGATGSPPAGPGGTPGYNPGTPAPGPVSGASHPTPQGGHHPSSNSEPGGPYPGA